MTRTLYMCVYSSSRNHFWPTGAEAQPVLCCSCLRALLRKTRFCLCQSVLLVVLMPLLAVRAHTCSGLDMWYEELSNFHIPLDLAASDEHYTAMWTAKLENSTRTEQHFLTDSSSMFSVYLGNNWNEGRVRSSSKLISLFIITCL